MLELSKIYISENKLDSAVFTFTLAAETGKIDLANLVSDEFMALHDHPNWHLVESRVLDIEKETNPDLNTELALLFARVYAEDQSLRIKEDRTKDWDSLNRSHISILDSVVREFGFPNTDMVGEGGMDGVYVALQHLGDPKTQRYYFEIWREQARTPFELGKLAYLEDRLLVNEIGYQKYGTQFIRNPETNELTPYPLLFSEAQMDAYRQKLGWPTLSEYIDLINSE